jgi:hypothetical protein
MMRADVQERLLKLRLALLERRISKGLGRDAEHRAVIKYNGDFDFKGLLQHLKYLGGVGASRDVVAFDSDDKPVKFGWDGDGADKIVSAKIDGKDCL